ncbi:MAG: DUF4387 domain-containing protein [Firmicutes bacterium]|nr:DUF4387 domain-containing protein [Bacillota bacterium]
MEKLNDIAAILRSKNAGPLNVTFDIMFDSREAYLRVMNSGVLTPALIAQLYDVPEKYVDVIGYDIVDSIKVTIPRKVISGALEDTDIYGCQQQAALANIMIP